MKLSVFPFFLLAVTAEVISSRALQDGESDFPSMVPTVSPAPTMMEGSDIPSDLPSDILSDVPSDVPTMPPLAGGTVPPVSDGSPTLSPAPATSDVPNTAAPPLELPTSSSIVPSCVGLVLAVAGLAL